jgi:hypothetical protein
VIPNLSEMRREHGCLPTKENFESVLGEELVRGEISATKELSNLNEFEKQGAVRFSREFCLDPYVLDTYKTVFRSGAESEASSADEALWSAHLWIDGLWSQEFSMTDMQNFVKNFRTELNVSHLFRIGFIFDQAELYESAAMGFDGVFLHVGELDIYNLQLFTEVGRELALHIVWICENREHVERVLETDCPNIGLSVRFSKSSQSEEMRLQELRSLMPNNVKPWLFASKCNTKTLNFAKLQKFSFLGAQV